MPWYKLDVILHVEAPTDEAAELFLNELEEPIWESELITGPPVAEGEQEPSEDNEEQFLLPVWQVRVPAFIEEASASEAYNKTLNILKDEAVYKYFKDLGKAEEVEAPDIVLSSTKNALSNAKDWLSDMLREDIEALLAGADFEDLLELPDVLPSAYAYLYNQEFFDKFVAAIDEAERKLSSYPAGSLNSTAEELAAHALISQARASLEMLEEQGEVDEKEAKRGEAQLTELKECAFEDHNVLMLFNGRFDGIDDVEEFAHMGFTNLKVKDWFKPFR